ncbi:MAG: DUF4115 domain-containing protein [Gammaproteobacteria bacterium]|nr:DUF4115 domain-containing protein [Gammaproteobacteria bacterium]
MTSQKELIPLQPGDILRYEREQQGLTLERASSRSRIRLSVLEAIESGQTNDIPSVYLRGYIRNYARYLGVDPADIEDHMDNVRGAEPDVQTVFTVKTGRDQTEKWLKVSSYLAASALIAVLAWQFTHGAVRFSQGESQRTTAEADAESRAASPAEPAGRPTNTHLSASIASVEVLQRSAADAAPTAASGEFAAAAGEHLLTMSSSADTWVEIVDADGAHLEMDLLRAGTSRSYSGTAPYRIMIGRASAVELSMDGQLVDLGPHTRGNVAHLTLGGQAADASEPR